MDLSFGCVVGGELIVSMPATFTSAIHCVSFTGTLTNRTKRWKTRAESGFVEGASPGRKNAEPL